MKILVSSKALAKKLSEINFDNDDVYNVTLNPIGNTTTCELSVNTKTQSFKIMVESIIFRASMNQEGRRWDCIKDLLSMVADQPVVLNITGYTTSVIFQY